MADRYVVESRLWQARSGGHLSQWQPQWTGGDESEGRQQLRSIAAHQQSLARGYFRVDDTADCGGIGTGVRVVDVASHAVVFEARLVSEPAVVGQDPAPALSIEEFLREPLRRVALGPCDIYTCESDAFTVVELQVEGASGPIRARGKVCDAHLQEIEEARRRHLI